MQKKLFSAASAAILIAHSALAAGPAPKTPPTLDIPPPPLWSGFYLGFNAGYGGGVSTNASTISAPGFDGIALAANTLDPDRQLPGTGLVSGGTALASSGIARLAPNGFVGGGQIGYNYQWGSSFLVGFEADFQGATIRGSGKYSGIAQDGIAWKDPVFPGLAPCSLVGCNFTRTALGSGEISVGTDWIGTVRGRLGYLVTPTLLVFGTGGLAYGGVHASASHAATSIGTLTGANDALNPVPFPYSVLNGTYVVSSLAGVSSFSGTRAGWTAGGGVEWMLAPNWSFKAEGLYYNLGSVALQSSPVTLLSPITIALGGINVSTGQLLVANTPVTRIGFEGVMARAGLNYHFNFGAASTLGSPVF